MARKKKKKIRKKDRVCVYFDGSNFYHKLKELKVPDTTYFDYLGLAKWLARGRNIAAARYYIGVVRAKKNDKKGQALRVNQQRLFAHLKRGGFNIKGGYLMENEGIFHEKGTDVKIAIDLVVGAYENYYDAAILISSDTDLIPAIRKVKRLGKKVEYVGFSHRPSLGMQAQATLSRLLIKEELMKFARKRTSRKMGRRKRAKRQRRRK